jgi:hypothetical protein
MHVFAYVDQLIQAARDTDRAILIAKAEAYDHLRELVRDLEDAAVYDLSRPLDRPQAVTATAAPPDTAPTTPDTAPAPPDTAQTLPEPASAAQTLPDPLAGLTLDAAPARSRGRRRRAAEPAPASIDAPSVDAALAAVAELPAAIEGLPGVPASEAAAATDSGAPTDSGAADELDPWGAPGDDVDPLA